MSMRVIRNKLLRGSLLLGAMALAACSNNDAPAAATTATVTAATAGGQLEIAFLSDPTPPHTGTNNVKVTVKQPDGTPINDAEVTAVFYMPAMPTMNMPEMHSDFVLAPQGEGTYAGEGDLVMGGTWNVTVDVARGGEKVATSKFSVIAD